MKADRSATTDGSGPPGDLRIDSRARETCDSQGCVPRSTNHDAYAFIDQGTKHKQKCQAYGYGHRSRYRCATSRTIPERACELVVPLKDILQAVGTSYLGSSVNAETGPGKWLIEP